MSNQCAFRHGPLGPLVILSLLLVGSPAMGREADASRTTSAADQGTGITQSILAAVLGQYGRITSTGRSVAHNRAVGGVANSYHLVGRAVDVARRPGVAHWQVAAVLRSSGYQLIESLDEGDHSHFAFAIGRARPVSEIAAVRSPVAPPQAALQNALLADDHGTLSIDLARPPIENAGSDGSRG